MSKTPTVSVIIPFYNGESFVFDAVENLKKQDFKDFEIILVNDGSTDNTAQKLNEVKAQNPDLSITVINKENGGVSTARNCGIEAARGEWLCFCDDDDITSKNYISLLYNAAIKSNSKLSLGYITKQKEELFEDPNPEIKFFNKTEFLREFLYNGIKYSHCAAIFHKSLFENGNRYPENSKYSEDVYLLWKLFSISEKIPVVCHPLYYYYQNPNSAMNKKMTLDRMGAIELMKDLEAFIEQNAPEFSPEYKNFAVARHYWSILWQAAGNFPNYKEFKEYIGNFDMKPQLKKLYTYPSKKVTITSRLFNLSPFMYYLLMRIYVRHFK